MSFDPEHRERENILAAGNNSRHSRHFIIERPIRENLDRAPYRALEGHPNEGSVIASRIHLSFLNAQAAPYPALAQVEAALCFQA